MEQFTVNPDRLVITILDKRKVMPLRIVTSPGLVDPGLSDSAATGRVEVNVASHATAPRNVGLDIAITARRALRPEPKGRRRDAFVQLLPQHNRNLVGIRRRLEPGITIRIRVINAHPFAVG